MDCKKQDKELQQLCSQRLATEQDPLERFKCFALKNGCAGIKTIGRKFRIMDDSEDKKLSVDEFIEGCRECRISKMTPEELKQVFQHFDKDGSGSLDFNEFLVSVRPKMNEARTTLVKKAYAQMDKTGDGTVNVDDVTTAYDVRCHPKFQNGEMSKKEVLMEFLKNFEAEDNVDGKVTMEEWLDYYSGVSASIDDDAYFSLMMFNSWKVKLND